MKKIQWLATPFLVALVILPRLSIDLYLPSLPNMVNALYTNDMALQSTMTIFMFGYAMSMLLTGPLSDHLGRKKVMRYGLFLYVISTFICAIAPTISVLIIARFFQALGGCSGTVVARVVVKESYNREEQIKMLAHLSSAIAICPLIIPILGGFLQMNFGWRSIFFLLMLFAILMFIFGEFQLEGLSDKKALFSIKTLIFNYKELLTNHIFIGYSITIGLAWSNYFAFTLESPFLIQRALKLNSLDFGFIFSLVVLGYLMGTRLTRLFANKIGWNKSILIAIYFSIAGALLMMLLIFSMKLRWEILAFPMFFIMCGVGIIIPCTQAAVIQPFSTIAGTASGLFFFIQMLFGGISGLIVQSFQRDSAIPLTLMILVSSILSLVFFYKMVYTHYTSRC